jgi:dipeptidyl aminopeptidase/acylaminoacyl peptidase
MLAWVTTVEGYSQLGCTFASDQGTSEASQLPKVPKLPRGLYSLKWAPKAHKAMLAIEGPQIPGDIWCWDADTGEVSRSTTSDAAGLDLSAMVMPKHCTFTARDGVKIHGLLYTPRAAGTVALPPVLVNVHGGPTWNARPRFEPELQYLLSRGVAVFDLNYRGSLGYGKAFARLNDRRNRANEYLDMADAVDWLNTQRVVDCDRTAVMGASYGGYLTMAAMSRLPGTFDAGVAIVGVSNWVTALEGASPSLLTSARPSGFTNAGVVWIVLAV